VCVFAKQALQALQLHSLHVHISLQGSGLVVGFVRAFAKQALQALQISLLHVNISRNIAR